VSLRQTPCPKRLAPSRVTPRDRKLRVVGACGVPAVLRNPGGARRVPGAVMFGGGRWAAGGTSTADGPRGPQKRMPGSRTRASNQRQYTDCPQGWQREGTPGGCRCCRPGSPQISEAVRTSDALAGWRSKPRTQAINSARLLAPPHPGFPPGPFSAESPGAQSTFRPIVGVYAAASMIANEVHKELQTLEIE